MNIETLYESYSRDVFRFALYLSGNWEDAEDITAETFVRAWVAKDSIRLATVKGYLFAIARNLFLQDLRKKTRHTELDEEIADTRRGQDHYVEKRDEYEAVLRRMRKLPEVDRAALLMRAFGQIPYEEIAQVLAISIASAKVKFIGRGLYSPLRRRMSYEGYSRGDCRSATGVCLGRGKPCDTHSC